MGKARRRSAPVVVVIGLIAVVQGAVMVALPIRSAQKRLKVQCPLVQV